MSGNRRKGKGKASSSSAESEVQICVEFVDADLSYTINLSSSMAAEDAFNESVQMGFQMYPVMTGIDQQEFRQYPIAGLEKLTLGEWAANCYGAPPTVLLSTTKEKGLLAKCKATNNLLAKETNKFSASEKNLKREAALARGLFNTERDANRASEKRVKEVEEELGGKAQLEQELNTKLETQKKEAEELNLKYQAEKAKASTCEDNLAKVLARIDILEKDVRAEKDARAQLEKDVKAEKDARVLLGNQVVALEKQVAQQEVSMQNQQGEITSLKTTLEVFTGPWPEQP